MIIAIFVMQIVLLSLYVTSSIVGFVYARRSHKRMAEDEAAHNERMGRLADTMPPGRPPPPTPIFSKRSP